MMHSSRWVTGRRISAHTDRPPVWALLAAASFCGYFSLLVYCDISRPENPGFLLGVSPEGTVLVVQVVPGTPAHTAGLEPGDRIISLHGIRLASTDSWSAFGVAFEKNVPMPLVIERGGRLLVVPVTLRPAPASYWLKRAGYFLLIVRLAQLITLLSGLLVFWRRPRDPVAMAAAWLLLTCAVFTIGLPLRIATVWAELPIPVGLLLWPAYVSALLIGPILLTFVATFPRRLPYARYVLAGSWTIAAAVAALPLYNFVDVVYGGATLRSVGPGTQPLLLVTVVSLAGSVAIVAMNYRRIEDLNERRRLRAVVAGIATGVLPGFSLTVWHWTRQGANLASALFESPLLVVAAVALLATPLSISYAVLRHRLFDVSFIIRGWLQYALARWAVLSLAPLLVAGLVLDLLAHGHETVYGVLRRHGPLYATLIVGAAGAYAARQRWLQALDRRFFRERQHGYVILRDVAEGIRRSGSVEAVAPQVVARIEAALHPEFAAILVRVGDGTAYRTLAAAPAGCAPGDLEADSKLVALARVFETPLDTSDDEGSVRRHVQARDREFLERTGVDLLVPVITPDDDLTALLLLGRKRSDEPYAPEDHDLLVAISENLALLIARSAPTPRPPLLEECPECGACFDAGTRRCEHDSCVLAVHDLPRKLAGRYQLLRRIALGGMGAVYEAVDTALDKRVAVKLVRTDLPVGWNAESRLGEEARLAARLVHPNVVTVLDFGLIDGSRPFLVMERLVGRTLRQQLERGTPLTGATAISLLQGICSAIDTAHRYGLIHRDLKPENVIVTEAERGPIPKILDFGIAVASTAVARAAARCISTPGLVPGTPAYMAPERLRGERPTPAWDLWSIAVMAYEMVTGHLPVLTAPPVDEWDPGSVLRPARPHCASFFNRALSIDPASRPASARAIVNGLEQALRADGVLI